VVACAITWPFFWWRDMHPESWRAWDVPVFVRGLAPALGPAVGALLALVLFRRTHHRTVSLLGSSPWRSLVFVAVPLALMTLAGAGGESPHLAGLLGGLSYTLYALGEELGWRGFLQDALRPLAPSRRFALIGVLWGAWHLTTFARGSLGEVVLRTAVMFPLLFIGGSWGLGQAVERTKSLAVASMLHLVFNLSRALPTREALGVLGVSAGVWFVLLRAWPRPAAAPVAGTPDAEVAAG
jgi:hypothetical protein